MKKIITALLVILLVGQTSGVAQATDFARSSPYVEEARASIDAIIDGSSDMRPHPKEDLCRFVETDFLFTELGKIEYEHIFHEINNEEQKKDILALRDVLKNEKNCKKRFRLWADYDDKWYVANRKKEIVEREKQEKQWVSKIVDTGEDVWDGVINGVFFAIPRSEMWFGSRAADGISDGKNLLISYEGKNGTRVDIAAVLERARTREDTCLGFEKPTCKQSSFQAGFTTRYVQCRPYVGGMDLQWYKALWRKKCIYKENGKRNLLPVFDKDLDMWRIGEAGYYIGDPEFPSYFLICAKPGSEWGRYYKKPRCTSAVYLGDKVYAYYSFPQETGFWHHKEIHDTVAKKIKSFIIKE